MATKKQFVTIMRHLNVYEKYKMSINVKNQFKFTILIQ